MDLRVLGCILLIIGTSIGAGILALPIVTAAAGFYYACLLLISCWIIMTLGAVFIMEVNLKMPLYSNLITMAKKTLGIPGQIITWITCLLLLYSLLAAYLSGGTGVVTSLLALVNISLSHWINTLIFLLILGFIVYQGTRSIDWLNRGLMSAKLGVFLLLILMAAPHVQTNNLVLGSFPKLFSAIMVVITSFGFAVIIPSLRIYLDDNAKKLRITVLSASFIALLCYFFWILIIQGNIEANGPNGLINMASSSNTVGSLTATLIRQLHNPIVTTFVHFFTSICMVTSFLGVSLSLSDFLADGLRMKKQGSDNLIIHSITFAPPLILVLFMPNIFIKALTYAGICCVILLILIPSLMSWRSSNKSNKNYLFGLVILIAILLLIIAAIN